MKKIKIINSLFTIFILMFVFAISVCMPTFANIVTNMKIDVLVHDDGSATMTQVWTGIFNGGTEVYVPIDDTSLTVSNLKVGMLINNNTVMYDNENNWDVNASFEEKAYKCGINKTQSGVEICFGISEYGNRTYTFSYDITPLVNSYNDYDGFIFQFVNSQMSTFPTKIDLWTLRLENEKPLSTDNARIWGFGFNGEAYVQDGIATAKSNDDLKDGESLIIMMRLNKGLLSPQTQKGFEFEEIKDTAFVDSSYAEDEESDRIIKIVQLVIVVIILILFIVCLILLMNRLRRKNQLKKFYSSVNYFRDIPNQGKMLMTNILCEDFNIWNMPNGNIIGALIMKMINDKNIIPYQEKEVGLFGIEKKSTSLVLIKSPVDENAKSLYSIMQRAARADNVLQEKELKEYSYNHYEEMVEYINNVEGEGRRLLNEEGGYIKLLGTRLQDLSSVGQKELSEAYGLRKYLDEFTLVHERDIFEINIWENLLIYATLFGLAKKVLQDLKKIYPEQIDLLQEYNNTIILSNIYYNSLYTSAISAMKASESSSFSGMGGSTSIGGGGGFSGGGCGGGTR